MSFLLTVADAAVAPSIVGVLLWSLFKVTQDLFPGR